MILPKINYFTKYVTHKLHIQDIHQRMYIQRSNSNMNVNYHRSYSNAVIPNRCPLLRNSNIFVKKCAKSQCIGQSRKLGGSKNANAFWNIEKIGTILLIGLIPAVVISPSPPLDYAMVGVLCFHHYVGIHHILIDYARPIVLGSHGAQMFHITNFLITLLMAVGMVKFIQQDIGIGNAVREMWSINSDAQT